MPVMQGQSSLFATPPMYQVEFKTFLLEGIQQRIWLICGPARDSLGDHGFPARKNPGGKSSEFPRWYSNNGGKKFH